MDDTQRLDWVLANQPDFDHTWQTKIYWVRWYHESHFHVARGSNWREAIENAINGKIETF
jgi:hypothetical protein